MTGLSVCTLAAFPAVQRYSFNAMCLLAIDTAEAANVVARITTTTTLAGASAGVASIGLSYYRTRTYNMLDICVGMLGGELAREREVAGQGDVGKAESRASSV